MKRVTWLTFMYAFMGMLTVLGDKMTDDTAWSSLLTPSLVVFSLLGFLNGFAAHVTSHGIERKKTP